MPRGTADAGCILHSAPLDPHALHAVGNGLHPDRHLRPNGHVCQRLRRRNAEGFRRGLLVGVFVVSAFITTNFVILNVEGKSRLGWL